MMNPAMLAASMANPDDLPLVRQVRQLCAQLPEDVLPTLLVVPFDVAPQELMGLAALPAVAGCLAKGAGAEAVGPNIGSIASTGEWAFPPGRSRSVCYLGWSRTIRPRRLFESLLRGMSRVVALDSVGKWRSESITTWYLGYLRSRSEQFRLLRSIDIGEPMARRRQVQDSPHAMQALGRIRSSASLQPDPDKVMLVTGSLSAGGAERQVLNTVVGLRAKGYVTEVLCFNAGQLDLDFYLERVSRHAQVFSFDNLAEDMVRSGGPQCERVRERLSQPELGEFIRQLPMALREPVLMTAIAFLLARPAIVHLWQDYTNIVGGLAALIAGVPRVVLAGRSLAPHHFGHFRSYMHPLYRLLLAFPEVHLVNNSHAGAHSYAQWLGIDTDAIGVIHNGIDTTAFRAAADARDSFRRRWRIERDAPLVGGVLRLSSEKDPLLWIETAASIRQRLPDARFVIAGDGVMRADVEARVRELGLEEALHLAGVIDDIPGALSAFDLLLLTSSEEGLPNVLIEAQLAGRPVVTTDVGGAAETLSNGTTGWAVRERSAAALAERCCAVLSDHVWRASVSRLGPEHIEANFGLARMLRDTLRVYAVGKEAG